MYPLGRDDVMYEGFCSELYEGQSTINVAGYSCSSLRTFYSYGCPGYIWFQTRHGWLDLLN